MENIKISDKDQLVMSLVHYFVTKENYSPVVVKGSKDEIWLENLTADYKVIRINSKYIHNDEQFDYDIIKIKHVLKQIKKKTMTFKLNAFNICLDVSDRVNIKNENKVVYTVGLNNLNELNENNDIKSIFPNIDTKKLEKADNLDLILNVTNDINEKTEKDNKIFEEVFKSKKIVVTYALIAMCAFLFMFTYVYGNGSTDIATLLYYGASNVALVQSGEIYRIVTSMFLHAGILHLLVNMYSLYIIGTQLETFVGRLKFAGIYLISGISGSLLSLVFADVTSISVGASGAIFGLMGALLYFGYHYRLYLNDVLRKQLIPIILINLFIGFSLSGIDNAAHIGGLIGGYLSAVAFGLKGKSEKREMINGIVALIVYIAFTAYMVFR